MAQRKTAEEDTRTQRQKFIDTAREHGASENIDAFRRAVRSIATAKPMPKPKVGKKRKR
jgi:hypothetical protein